MTALADWDNFYIIVGPAAGALIGLQFVVMTLVAANPPPRAAEGGPAFSTPTIIHFGGVLLIAAVLMAPWHGIAVVAALVGLIGLGGFIYSILVARRMARQSAYRPVFEDWLFHAALPIAAYAALALSSLFAASHAREALFAVGAAVLLLLFIGIHNSWDAIAYHVYVRLPSRGPGEHRDEEPKEERK